MNNKLNKVVIATGGTGGHVFPAYSLAKHLINKKIETELFSDQRGLGFLTNLKDIKKTKILSSPIKKDPLNLFKSFILIISGILKSFFVLISKKPDIVFGMGGYSSFPVCFAAKILKIPYIIYENNICLGKTNRILLPSAKKLFVSFDEIEDIPEKFENKKCVVGNIIRKEFLNFEYNKKNYLEEKTISILVLGGSQAAKIFGEKLPTIFKYCNDNKIPLKIYQQCLPNQSQALKNLYGKLNIDHEIFNFTDNLLEYLSKTTLTITRSGSSMLAELLNTNKPFICVPLPSSAKNHQLKNATYYKKKGYSFLIEEKFLSEKLFNLIKEIYENKSIIKEMISKQSLYSDKLVYENIDREIENLINEKN
tara:strand:- start:276 stop:1373 length:1098 start_codon:yes stop_codon:yes gene_type:complete